MIACLIMAVVGYLTFGSKTEGNVLNNFPTDNVMVNIARLSVTPSLPSFDPTDNQSSCFGLNMLTTLPLENFVCREVMTTYYFPHESWDPNRHLLFTTVLVFTAMALSLLTCDLGVVFELVGATSACALAYIFPPICYMKLASRSWRTWAAGGVAAFGCTVMLISTVLSVSKIMRGGGEGKKCS